MSPRLWRHRITDILQAIEKIQLYVKGLDFEAFRQESKTIDAVIRNFIVIGKAAHNVPQEITSRHLKIPWRLMSDMRNLAVHEYWGVELRTIWGTIQEDLPVLVPLLEEILKEDEEPG
jgi:uncharacterized protein with HEPN domain